MDCDIQDGIGPEWSRQPSGVLGNVRKYIVTHSNNKNRKPFTAAARESKMSRPFASGAVRAWISGHRNISSTWKTFCASLSILAFCQDRSAPNMSLRGWLDPVQMARPGERLRSGFLLQRSSQIAPDKFFVDDKKDAELHTLSVSWREAVPGGPCAMACRKLTYNKNRSGFRFTSENWKGSAPESN